MIYLDSAATSFLKPPQVLRAVQDAFASCASPGRGGHRAAMTASDKVYVCRQEASELFDCQPEQVVFTTNATHGLNMAIRTLVPPGGRAVISGFEHNAVWRPLHALGAQICVAGRKLFAPEDTLVEFSRELERGADCVICSHVSNVFGYIQPVEELAELCRARGVPFILDASQSAGCLPLSFQKLGADFIALPGHKGLCGPQGTGILLCGRLPEPVLCGGTGSISEKPEMPDFLPDRAEAGTPNVPGICGLLEGIRFVRRIGVEHIMAHEQMLCRLLKHRLSGCDGLRVFGRESGTQAGVLSLLIREEDCEQTARRLDESGIAVRAGLHCAPLAHESAGTLQTGTVRLSFSPFTAKWEVCHAAETLLRLAWQVQHGKNGK